MCSCVPIQSLFSVVVEQERDDDDEDGRSSKDGTRNGRENEEVIKRVERPGKFD